jgi:hypothetical protein
VTGRITHTDEFRVRSASGKARIIVCSEDHIERAGRGPSEKWYVPSGIKTYKFKNGEPVAKIGDAFLDRTGEIYQRIR